MSAFEAHPASGRVIATFSGFEADLLRSLTSQLVELLHNESAMPSDVGDPLEAMLDFSGPTTEPEDPVLARLFPTAYMDDDEGAAEFRRFTEGTLRSSKAAAASQVIDALEEAGLPPQLTEDGLVIDVELEPDEAVLWLRSFTDVRLAIASRLGIEEGNAEYWETLAERVENEIDEHGDPLDPVAAQLAQVYDIYGWIGWLQETLVDAVEALDR